MRGATARLMEVYIVSVARSTCAVVVHVLDPAFGTLAFLTVQSFGMHMYYFITCIRFHFIRYLYEAHAPAALPHSTPGLCASTHALWPEGFVGKARLD